MSHFGEVSYGGRGFEDFGIKAYCKNPYDAPAPNIETTHVAGMNGDVHFYYGDFQNVDVTYLCEARKNFAAAFTAFKAWLYKQQGYHKLEDYVYPDYYRMGVPVQETEIGKNRNTFEVTFSCKPQKFLKSGDKKYEFSATGKIHNPTLYDSKPLLRVYGTGALQIGSETLTITANTDYTDIDCELQDAYHESDNRNGNIKLSSGDFPVLKPGDTGIVPASGMRVIITPRWYTI